MRTSFLVPALLATGCSLEALPEATGQTEAPLTSTVGFHRFNGSGGAELTAWGDRVVLTDVTGVELFSSDPATTTGIRNGTIGYDSSVASTAFVAATTGRSFTPLAKPAPSSPNGYVTLWAAGARGDKLFAIALENWSSYRLVRYDAPNAAPVTLASEVAYDVFADAQFVYTFAAGAAPKTYRIVRRAHDGSGTIDLGPLPLAATFLAITTTFAAESGFAFTIPNGQSDLLRYGPTGTTTIAGPHDSQATVAAAGGFVFVTASDGIWRGAVTGTSATLIRTSAQLHADAAIGSVTCGHREEYGRNGAFTADGSGVYVICDELNGQRNVALTYSHAGALLKRVELPTTWSPLGRLRATTTHLCATQQLRYSSSNKTDILRCLPR